MTCVGCDLKWSRVLGGGMITSCCKYWAVANWIIRAVSDIHICCHKQPCQIPSKNLNMQIRYEVGVLPFTILEKYMSCQNSNRLESRICGKFWTFLMFTYKSSF